MGQLRILAFLAASLTACASMGMPDGDAGRDAGPSCIADLPCAVPGTCESGTTQCSSATATPTCTGTAGIALRGAVCRAAASDCDVAERCSGDTMTCPLDLFAPAGSSCGTGSCSGAGSCVCVGTCTSTDAFVQLALGTAHTCARRASGAVACWGNDTHGELGDGPSTTEQHAPVTVAGLRDVAEIVAGDTFTCARRTSGTVACWGQNLAGQLGNGTVAWMSGPVDVVGVSDATSLAAGGDHACAVRADRSVVCWGANSEGELGDGTTTLRTSPVVVAGLDATQLVAGAHHTCARTSGGAAMCWGANDHGQLGHGAAPLGACGAIECAPAPVAVAGPTTYAHLAAGAVHTCGVDESGNVWCWGDNTHGEFGDGSTMSSFAPVPMVGVSSADAIACGRSHTCWRAGGVVACTGLNNHGELGDTSRISRNAGVLTTIDDATTIAAGGEHTCATRATGVVACWGSNASGEIGDGTVQDRTIPTVVLETGS